MRWVWTLVLCVAAVLVSSLQAEESMEREITGPVAEARIEVLKAERLLRLYSGESLLREYAIGLGFNPVGDKQRQGDGATPEGRYHVCVKNPQSRYYLSVGLSYPNLRDAEKALGDQRITEDEFSRIAEAERRGRRPPWDTPLGGEIYIHGRGASSDWTLGCVALDDGPMKELYAAVSVGTEVLIRP